MEYPSSEKVFPCVGMVQNPPKAVQNSNVPGLVSSEVLQNVHVKILALMLVMAEQCIWLQKIIQDYSTIRLVAAGNGRKSTTHEHLPNVVIKEKRWTTN